MAEPILSSGTAPKGSLRPVWQIWLMDALIGIGSALLLLLILFFAGGGSNFIYIDF